MKILAFAAHMLGGTSVDPTAQFHRVEVRVLKRVAVARLNRTIANESPLSLYGAHGAPTNSASLPHGALNKRNKVACRGCVGSNGKMALDSLAVEPCSIAIPEPANEMTDQGSIDCGNRHFLAFVLGQSEVFPKRQSHRLARHSHSDAPRLLHYPGWVLQNGTYLLDQIMVPVVEIESETTSICFDAAIAVDVSKQPSALFVQLAPLAWMCSSADQSALFSGPHTDAVLYPVVDDWVRHTDNFPDCGKSQSLPIQSLRSIANFFRMPRKSGLSCPLHDASYCSGIHSARRGNGLYRNLIQVHFQNRISNCLRRLWWHAANYMLVQAMEVCH